MDSAKKALLSIKTLNSLHLNTKLKRGRKRNYTRKLKSLHTIPNTIPPISTKYQSNKGKPNKATQSPKSMRLFFKALLVAMKLQEDIHSVFPSKEINKDISKERQDKNILLELGNKLNRRNSI